MEAGLRISDFLSRCLLIWMLSQIQGLGAKDYQFIFDEALMTAMQLQTSNDQKGSMTEAGLGSATRIAAMSI